MKNRTKQIKEIFKDVLFVSKLTGTLNKKLVIFLAILNELVWRTQPETTWVNFKVWGILPLTFIFTAIQIPMINKHKI